MTAPVTATCSICGMPLAYEAFARHGTVLDAAPAELRCAVCSGAEAAADHSSPEAPPWLLDRLLDVYRHDRRAVRAVAQLLSRTPLIRTTALGQLLALIADTPRPDPRATHDIMVLYSGGKDSSFMLKDLAGRGLRVVAWMLDQGYQSPAAMTNARRVCDQLGVDFVIDRPGKAHMDQLFRLGFSIKPGDDPDTTRSAMTYGSACWPCFSTIATQASLFAAERHIPLCFIGTQKGQNRLDLHGQPALSARRLPRLDDMSEKFVERFRDLVATTMPERAAALTPAPSATVLVPFYEFVDRPPYTEQIASLRAIGWDPPGNTGMCSSNCMINELGRHVMRHRFGFDLYQLIEANEQRLTGTRAEEAPLDATAVELGALLIRLSDKERAEIGLAAKRKETAPAAAPAETGLTAARAEIGFAAERTEIGLAAKGRS